MSFEISDPALAAAVSLTISDRRFIDTIASIAYDAGPFETDFNVQTSLPDTWP